MRFIRRGLGIRAVDRSDPDVDHSVPVRCQPRDSIARRRELRIRTVCISKQNLARNERWKFRLCGSEGEQDKREVKAFHVFAEHALP